MAADFQVDKYGGEYRVTEGKESIALWLPMTLAEKEKMMALATAKGKPVGELVADFLRKWMKEQKGPELSADDLQKVVGGLMKSGSRTSTYMCPW